MGGSLTSFRQRRQSVPPHTQMREAVSRHPSGLRQPRDIELGLCTSSPTSTCCPLKTRRALTLFQRRLPYADVTQAVACLDGDPVFEDRESFASSPW